MNVLEIVLIIFGLMILIGFIVTYSWTFTPFGRIDYIAAIISKITARQSIPNFTPEEREESNKWTKRMLGSYNQALIDSIKDYNVNVSNGIIKVRVYTPKGDGPFPLLLEIHGGGFWMGNDFCMEKPIIEMAAKLPAVVVSVDYRLAPEHTYPTQLNDCLAALNWAIEQADSLQIDPSRIALMGTSAGGNLASALALKLRDEGGSKIRYQFLSVPVTNIDQTNTVSFREFGNKYMNKASDLEVMYKNYVPDSIQRKEGLASPLLANSHKNLPPALIITAQFDPLRDEGKAYADKLKTAGVETTYLNIEGAIHGFVGSKKGMKIHNETAISKIRDALYS